jgi:hypothetical protein
MNSLGPAHKRIIDNLSGDEVVQRSIECSRSMRPTVLAARMAAKTP